MEMLVTKFSTGKYRNERELFSEPISENNVKLMGEMIALQLFRTRKRHYCEIADKLYIGLIKDLHHMNETDYTVSDGYDYAQAAMCFLWQFKGRKAEDICHMDKYGKAISIKLACYRETGRRLDRYLRNKARTVLKIFDDYKALPADPVNCFEKEEPDHDRADAVMDAMRLTEAERETVACYMNGMTQSEAAAVLGITIFGVKYRKLRIRQKYHMYVGVY